MPDKNGTIDDIVMGFDDMKGDKNTRYYIIKCRSKNSPLGI